MTEKTYRYRLVIKDRIAYESTIDAESHQKALSWGFYWIAGDWSKCDYHEPVHVEIKMDNSKQMRSWSCYHTRIMDDMSHFKSITNEDVRHLVAGQDLVWRIVDKMGYDMTGRIFRDYKSAIDYSGLMHKSGILDVYTRPVWVDGWYDEQDSWKATSVKGYKLRSIETEETV